MTAEFQFNATPYGKLILLRTIHLDLKLPALSALSVFSFTAGQPASSRQQEERDECWQWWSQHVFDISIFHDVTCHGFPALGTLTLDFSNWQLTEDESVFVNPPDSPRDKGSDNMSRRNHSFENFEVIQSPGISRSKKSNTDLHSTNSELAFSGQARSLK